MTLTSHFSGAFLDISIQCIISKVWNRMLVGYRYQLSRIAQAWYLVCWPCAALLGPLCLLLTLFFLPMFFQNNLKFNNAVIWILCFRPPPCSLIIPVLKEWVRIPGDFAGLCSTWGGCALSQLSYWSLTGTWTNCSSSL